MFLSQFRRRSDAPAVLCFSFSQRVLTSSSINEDPCPQGMPLPLICYSSFRRLSSTCPTIIHLTGSLLLPDMPLAKPKPSDIAVDAKKRWFPWILDNFPDWSPTSYLCYSESIPINEGPSGGPRNIRFAFYDRDPVDVALDWDASEEAAAVADGISRKTQKIPIIMPANDKRPGGDWEAGKCSHI